jgi:hypothetical protein
MKKLLLIALSIVSFTVCSQNIAELEKEKTTLDAQRSIIQLLKKNISREYDSILAIKESDIKKLKLVLIPINKSIDSLKQIIASFGISENNFNMYNLLKKENVIDQTTKKYNSFYKQLMKEFSFSEGQKFLIVQDFICLEKFDATGRLYSFDKIPLTSDQIEKQKKLLSKGSILYLKENDVFLENLTGVNANYLSLLQQMEALNQSLEVIGNDINKIEDLKKQLSHGCEQEKTKLDNDYDQISTSITEINNQITIINEQTRLENQRLINYSKFKTKNVNGIEICTTPLTVREFRNGDEIKKARTEGEWSKFNELMIPSYHFKDFDDKEGNYGFIYNLYAIADDRELAPLGFHKLNLIDYNSLEDQSIFTTETKLVDCWCGDGKEGIYESCTNCNFWTESQRKYNVCSKCQNSKKHIVGKKKCSWCNGKKTIRQSQSNMEDREFSVFPTSTNQVVYGFNGTVWNDPTSLGRMEIDEVGKCNELLFNGNIKYNEIEKLGYQILICKDRDFKYVDDGGNTKIGDVEIMNSFLAVTKFKNGDPIKYIEDPIEWELALKNKIPAYCYYNNINTGIGCIYNKHAWSDKRGLLPKGWRSLTKYDLTNLSCSIGYEFSFNSAKSPVQLPPGTRNKNGIYEPRYKEKRYVGAREETNEKYFRHLNFEFDNNHEDKLRIVDSSSISVYTERDNKSGYVFCVRDASQNSLSKLIVNKNSTSLESLTSQSRVIPTCLLTQSTNPLKRKQEYEWEELKNSREYEGIYNESGIKIIEMLVNSDFEALFENNEMKLLALRVQSKCDGGGFVYDGNDGNYIYGIKIRKDLNNSLFCSIIEVSTSEYEQYKPSVRRYDEIELSRIEELIFKTDNFRIQFCFNPYICEPSQNPFDNFYVKMSQTIAYKNDWSDQVSVFYGSGHNVKVKWAIDQVLTFLNE